jgi:DNA-3-methyladenine glycosylase II
VDEGLNRVVGKDVDIGKRPAPGFEAKVAKPSNAPVRVQAPGVREVTPAYWDEACKHLVKRDRVMCKLIPNFGEARLQTRGDAFTTLARSIVGQQISVRSAQAAWLRFIALREGAGHDGDAHVVAPAEVLGMDVPRMREAGLSARKVEYLTDLATHFASGSVHPQQWQEMDDDAIVEELIAIRGIGRWTAEMFLIFHLMRPDVLPLDDVGLLKGISLNYFSGEPVSRAEAREVGDAWAPFRSVATWYIWRSLDPLPVVAV